MSWKEIRIVEERLKFVAALRSGNWSMSELCRQFGISRVTGYKFLSRYETEGIDGLKDRSHAVHNQPSRTTERFVRMILDMRTDHPTWGSRKLLERLRGRYPTVKEWPAASTVTEILRRAGRIQPRKQRRKNPVKVYPLSHVKDPNDVWCADFKGHFTVGDGRRCDPLTISDAHSRFLLACEGVKKANTEEVMRVFTAIFRENGLPEAIRTDNGTPFATSQALAGLSRLSVWWLKLAIRLERIRPGNPQENGRHERMHRTLKQETALPARSSLRSQQEAFDRFRFVYNNERPHEALAMKCPVEIYRPSRREFPERPPVVEYNTGIEPCNVSDEGVAYYSGFRIFLSSALRNETVGFEDIDERHRRIYFASAALGILDAFTGKLLHYKNPMVISDQAVVSDQTGPECK